MPDKSASSLLFALSAELAGLIRDVAPSLVSIQSGRAQSTGFSWRPGLIVAAENALADDGDNSIVSHDGASSPARRRPRSLDQTSPCCGSSGRLPGNSSARGPRTRPLGR